MNIICYILGGIFLLFATSIVAMGMIGKDAVRAEHPLILPALFAVSALFFIAAK